MKVFRLLQVWLTLILISFSAGARILAVAPFAFRSHQIFIQTVLKELALQGHKVVSYSPFPQQNPVPNYTDVQVNTSFSENFSKCCLDFLWVELLNIDQGLICFGTRMVKRQYVWKLMTFNKTLYCLEIETWNYHSFIWLKRYFKDGL